MIKPTTTETKQDPLKLYGFYSSFTGDLGFAASLPDSAHPVANPVLTQGDKNVRLELAIRELHIGQRIHEELKCQGRSVSWLAEQLGMQRASLYYTFRQDSIDLELLMHISAILNHDFTKDVADIFRKYEL